MFFHVFAQTTHVVAVPHRFACVGIPTTWLYIPSFIEMYYRTSRDKILQIWRIFKYKTRCSRSKQTLPPVLPPGNLDETRLSVVWSVLPSSELDETYASSLILSYSLHYMITWRHPQNRKYITLHCHQRRTKKWPYVARTANLVKFGLFFFQICKQTETNKQTDIHAGSNTLHRY